MKKFLLRISRIAALAVVMFSGMGSAKAQYAQIVNQLPEILSPALSGSMKYKGYVDVTSTFGIGSERANFVGISTSQGFRYANWFFMGAGIGVDVAMSKKHDMLPPGMSLPPHMSEVKAMLPLFTDFRFILGQGSGVSAFIDIKAGATWLLGSSYLYLNSSALTTQTQFLLRPSIGVRIPANSKNARQAVNLGLTYQLITANNSWGYWGGSNNATLNSLGLTVGYEW
ncbi:MAG: hypothetical protein K2G90_07500 [Muribaculaceae bacterium]|nr:hypothetical protein [Muribaculaceae bacterium]